MSEQHQVSLEAQAFFRKHHINLLDASEVELIGHSITDSDLKYLAEIPTIRTLNLSNNNITDTGLEELAKLNSLESLSLSYS